jgi:hypothetical protein
LNSSSVIGRRFLVMEALSFGLAYSAGLCWTTTCLLASFRPIGLSAPYWTGLPHLRSDTFGIVGFFAVALLLPCSEFLRLHRRSRADTPPHGLACSYITRAAGLAVTETIGSLSTGLVLYLSINVITHPATLTIQATHLTPWPTEGTLRVIALLLCIPSAAGYRLFSGMRSSCHGLRGESTVG